MTHAMSQVRPRRSFLLGVLYTLAALVGIIILIYLSGGFDPIPPTDAEMAEIYGPPEFAHLRSPEDSTPNQRYAAMGMIKADGYDCKTMNFMIPWSESEGWTVICNDYRYKYELANHGGKWTVKAP